MKKKSLVLFPLLFLVACSQSEVGSEPLDYYVSYENSLPVVTRDVSGNTVYLTMARYGRVVINEQLVEGSPFVDEDRQMFYDNCVKYVAKAGTALPDAVFYKDGEVKDDVTFRGWFFYFTNTDKVSAEKVEAVSSEAESIAYAIFDGPTGGSGGIVTEGYGIRFSDGTKVYAAPFGSKDEQGRDQYLISNYTFAQGKSFSLYDYGADVGWVIDLDPYSFDGSASAPVWNTYLSKSTSTYTVLKTFTANVYIKLKPNDDQIYFGLA